MGSLALLTDLYQLSMACGYWNTQVAHQEAIFHLTFRRAPFGGSYAISCGLAAVLDYVDGLHFSSDDCSYLATLVGNDGKALFPADFIEYLRELRFDLTIDAIPEGRVVFAHEPLLRVRGPIVAAQLVETAMLTAINFQTLIATKASRVVRSAKGAAVLEFGLRRAQGFDGGLSASRASYIGGCAATSNVLAGKQFGIPVRGTHAHSWVMFHGDEELAFANFATAMPNNVTLLVDTYDTIKGVERAISVGKSLAAKGHQLAAIRLDSGDLAHLSQVARTMLDAAGFAATKIVASNDLDERLITSLHEQGANIDTFGVGTKLVTAYDQPALGGVYKLGAVADPTSPTGWRDCIKLSEQPIKVSNPGQLAVHRRWHGPSMVGDIIYDQTKGRSAEAFSLDRDVASAIPEADFADEVLVRVFEQGKRTDRAGWACDLEHARQRAQADLAGLNYRQLRFDNPEPYLVLLDGKVAAQKRLLIEQAKPKG